MEEVRTWAHFVYLSVDGRYVIIEGRARESVMPCRACPGLESRSTPFAVGLDVGLKRPRNSSAPREYGR